MMADARTPEMNAAYAAALARENKADSPSGPVQLPSEHRINLIGALDGERLYMCDCGVVGRFGEMTDENQNHDDVRRKHAVRG